MMRHLLEGSWVLLLLLFVGSCTCSPDSVNRGDLNLIPLDQEWQMGAQMAEEIARQANLVEDPAALAYLNQIGQQLVAETELSERPWQFHLIAEPSINAFAIPGGHIYVHTGLVEAAENAAELAGVMGHEVAHGVARHSTERLTKAYGLDFMARLVLGQDSGLLEQIIVQILGSGTIAKFSRDDEREADDLGLSYMHAAGFEPSAMARMFETMLAQRQRRPNALEQFFSTHPLTEERIEAISDKAAQLDDTGGLVTRDAGFQQFKQRLSRYNQ